MSYVERLNRETASESARPVLEAIEQKFGQSLEIFDVMAHQPAILNGIVQTFEGIHQKLPGRYRELAYYLASRLNDCAYCSFFHRQAALNEGLTEEQLDAITDYEASDAFSPEEKAVLQYTEQLTRTAHVDGETVNRVKQFLDDEQLVVLAATVALANFTNRFNHGVGILRP